MGSSTQRSKGKGMLVLTRNEGQRLIIGDKEMIITVLGISKNQVRIGINAPKHVVVHREEIYEKIKAQDKTENRGNK